MADILLPCPFCGGSDIQELTHLDWVACNGCGASLEDCEPSARALWNTRASQPVSVAQAQPQRDELARLLKGIATINNYLCENPPRVSDAAFGCEAMLAGYEPWPEIAQGAGDRGEVWQPIETAPRDGTPIEVCNTRLPSHAPVIVRWTEAGLSEDLLDEPHWCDAATADGSALYYNQNYFDFWKRTTALPSTQHPDLRCEHGSPPDTCTICHMWSQASSTPQNTGAK